MNQHTASAPWKAGVLVALIATLLPWGAVQAAPFGALAQLGSIQPHQRAVDQADLPGRCGLSANATATVRADAKRYRLLSTTAMDAKATRCVARALKQTTLAQAGPETFEWTAPGTNVDLNLSLGGTIGGLPRDPPAGTGLDFEPLTILGTLRKNDLLDRLESARPHLLQCYGAASTHPGGTVMLGWKVRVTGVVSDASVDEDPFEEDRVGRCVLQVVRSQTFAESAGLSMVRLGFHFSH